MALSVRELPNPEPGFWGTLLCPRPLELNLGQHLSSSGPDDGHPGWPFATTVLRTTLGYEAMPSTDFWLFKLDRPTLLKAERISQDPYGVHVAVALINAITNRRVVSLVHSQDGVGEEVQLEAGTYKLVVALGIAEKISKVEIRLHAHIPLLRMQGVAYGAGTATLLWKQKFLKGIARGRGQAQLLGLQTHSLVGVAVGLSAAAGRIGATRMRGVAWGLGDAEAHFSVFLQGLAVGQGVAAAQLAPPPVAIATGAGIAAGTLKVGAKAKPIP